MLRTAVVAAFLVSAIATLEATTGTRATLSPSLRKHASHRLATSQTSLDGVCGLQRLRGGSDEEKGDKMKSAPKRSQSSQLIPGLMAADQVMEKETHRTAKNTPAATLTSELKSEPASEMETASEPASPQLIPGCQGWS